MRRVLTIFAATLTTLLVAFAITLILIAWLVDPDDYREYAETYAERLTGRSVHIEEGLELSVFPWLGVRTRGIEIGNAEGFEDDFLSLEAADIRLRLLPLLRNRIELAEIGLEAAHLRLAVDADGRDNWSDLFAEVEASVDTVPEEPDPLDRALLEDLVIGGLRVDGARVDWEDAGEERQARIEDARLRMGELRMRRPVALNGQLAFQLREPEWQGKLELDTDLVVDPRGSRMELVDSRGALSAERPEWPLESLSARLGWQRLGLDLAEAGVTIEQLDSRIQEMPLTGEVAVSGLDAQPRAAFHLDAPAFDPAPLLQAMAEWLPEGFDAGEMPESAWAAQGLWDTAGDRLELDQLDLRLGEPELALEGVLEGLTNEPSAQGRYQLHRGDVESLLPAIRGWLPSELADLERGELESGADFLLNWSDHELALEDFSLGLDEAYFEGVAHVAGLDGLAEPEGHAPEISGELRADEFALAEGLAEIGLGDLLPERSDETALNQIAFATRFQGDGEQFDLQELDLRLDGSRVLGDIVVGLADFPAASFDLEIDRMDLDRYLPPDEAGQGPGKEPLDLDAVALPVAGLEELELDGRLRAGRLDVFDTRLDELALEVTASDGRLDLGPLDMQVFDGYNHTVLSLEVGDESPRLELREDLQAIRLEQLLDGMFGLEGLSGGLDIEAELQGNGHTIGELRPTLGGHLDLGLTDGELAGVDLVYELGRAVAIARGREHELSDRGVTPFRELSVNGQVEEGALISEDLRAGLAGLELRGDGRMSLVDFSLDYALEARVGDSPEQAELEAVAGQSLPLRLTGTLFAPRVAIDAGRLAREMGLDISRERIEDRLRRRLDR